MRAQLAGLSWGVVQDSAGNARLGVTLNAALPVDRSNFHLLNADGSPAVVFQAKAGPGVVALPATDGHGAWPGWVGAERYTLVTPDGPLEVQAVSGLAVFRETVPPTPPFNTVQTFGPNGEFVKHQDGSWLYLLLDEGIWQVNGAIQVGAPELAQIWAIIGTRPTGAPPPVWDQWDGVLPLSVTADVRFWPAGFGGVEVSFQLNAPYAVPEGEAHALMIAVGSDTGATATSRQFYQYLKATRIGSAA